jgi:hypothetical protein
MRRRDGRPQSVVELSLIPIDFIVALCPGIYLVENTRCIVHHGKDDDDDAPESESLCLRLYGRPCPTATVSEHTRKQSS